MSPVTAHDLQQYWRLISLCYTLNIDKCQIECNLYMFKMLYKCRSPCDAILRIVYQGASVKREKHGASIFATKLEENYRSVHDFWRKSGLEQNRALSFETLRRVILEDDHSVNAASLAIIMFALGFARSEIAAELKTRGDEYFHRLVYEPASEGEVSAGDRDVLDSLGQIGAHNQKLRASLTRLIVIAGGAPAIDVEDDRNGPLHVVAGARTSESMKPAFVHALEVLVEDLRGKSETPDQFRTEIDSKNSGQETPLMLACMAQNEEAALVLLEEGADVSMADSQGRAVMHYIDLHRLERVFEAVKETNPSAVMDFYVSTWSEADSVLHK